ncbi:MAG: sigma-70 family RNA polymerase sigma factor [Massilia sp.]
MRWQHRSVQFEAPQFLSWKIPSSDQQRDTTAYRRFLDQLAHRLRAYLKRRLVNMHDHIEDIVQETLLAVHNGRHSYRAEHPLTSWVHAIAKYKLMDFLRLRARGDALNDSLDDCEEIFSNADEEVAEARRDVHVLLAQLPDRQRLPIQLVKLQGLSVAEAAQATGFSESAVKIGVHRGLKALALHIRSVR